MNTPTSEQQDDLAQRAVESVARQSYGRLVALLSARTRDVAAAEDALADALMAALTTWPRDGVPQNPQAWLMTAARNRLLHHARHRWVRDNSAPTIELMMSDLYETADPDALPDSLLEAVPEAGYDPSTFAIRPARVTRSLSDGDLIDLGDRRLRVIHAPGHTPGSILLYDEDLRWLYTGDVLNDSPVFDEMYGADIPSYVRRSAMICSTCTAGGRALNGRWRGSITLAPSWPTNQSRPSAAFTTYGL